MHSKSRVLFFSRSFLKTFFSGVNSEFFEDIHVTLNKSEREDLESLGKRVVGCFEEEFNTLTVPDFPTNYLRYSFSSDRFLNRFDIEYRSLILGKEITFWRNILKKFQPDVIINETVAIELSEVLAIEAELAGIPVLSSLCSPIPGYFYWKANPFDGSIPDVNDIEPNESMQSWATEYFIQVSERQLKPLYVQTLNSKGKDSLWRLPSFLKHDLGLWLKKRKVKKSRIFVYEDYYTSDPFVKTKTLIRSYFGNYDHLSDFVGKKIIFYPLHYEPEATLFYFSEEYQNQLHTIELISISLKQNQYLVVKEHPQQKGRLMRADYSSLRKKHKNVVFIESDISSEELIKSSEAVVTLTSTAGWEALMWGIPVLVLGTIFYDQCSEVTKIRSYQDLKKRLRTSTYKIPEKKKVIDFIAKFMTTLHKGYPAPSVKVEDQFMNVKNYQKAIEQFLQVNNV